VWGDDVGELLPMLETSVAFVALDRFEIDEASDSSELVRAEEPEETLDEAFRCAWITETSGALYVSMLVVLSNCTGPEIVLISIGFSLYRMLAARSGGVELSLCLTVFGESDFLRRIVNARAMDDIVTAKSSQMQYVTGQSD